MDTSAMLEATIDDFREDPVGRYTRTRSSIVWCASRSLCGAYGWGRPNDTEARAVVDLFAQYPRVMAERFCVILDTRAVEVINPDALRVMFSWVFQHRVALLERVQLQASIIGEGANGYVFAGLLPAVGKSHPFRVFVDPVEAFSVVVGEREGPDLARQVEQIVARVREFPLEIHALRAILAARIDAPIEDAARELALSKRSLQRVLAKHGRSFHEEVNDARFALAQRLLLTTDAKLSEVARRVGLSERSLTLLFRAKTGLAPAMWRERQT